MRLPRLIKSLLKIVISPLYYCRIACNDLLAFLGKKPGNNRILFVAGYPKSGTTWVENFISILPRYSPRTLHGDQSLINNHLLPIDAFANFPKWAYSSVKTHVDPRGDTESVLTQNGITNVLVMFRDPRDIIVSNYYYVIKNNPWQVSDACYADYTLMNKQDALTHSMELVLSDFQEWVSGWMRIHRESPSINCEFVRFEDLRNEPEITFRRILKFFGISLSDKQLKKIMTQSSSKPLDFYQAAWSTINQKERNKR
jgi:hypothetical protein